ncbi:MAG: hypothetical protein JKX90_05805 [Colwellia sp.]|nr:hypothetical protein [Colwellia sp.]
MRITIASASTQHYNQLVNTADKHNCLWLGNTTVGAGRGVTAGDLHSDLVNICQQLVHRPQQVKIKGLN